MIENHQHFNLHVGHRRFAVLTVCLTALLVAGAVNARAAELLVGAATTSITPEEPVALIGSFSLRVAKAVESPLTATVLVLESREGEKVLDQAIVVSCDLCVIRGGLEEMFRERVKSRIAGLDVRKLFLTATHSHTAPVTSDRNSKNVRQNDPEVNDSLAAQSEHTALVERLRASRTSSGARTTEAPGKPVS